MKIELTPTGKLTALVLLVLGAIATVILQGPDAKRYFKMETM